MVHKLYEPYAHPFVRVVQGSPISWKPNVATQYHQRNVGRAVWSPCGGFIAVALSDSIEVLDVVTLERLYTFEHPRDWSLWLCFSPDSRLLTRFNNKLELTSWDLQTGGPVSTIPGLGDPRNVCISSTYSTDGKLLAVAYEDIGYSGSTILIYDLLSRTCTCCYDSPQGPKMVSIWTHGGCIRFAVVGSGSITIWEVGFTSTDAPIEVERFPVPGNFGYLEGALFLPALSRFASNSQAGVMVWDARNSKLLLNTGKIEAVGMSFSYDGRFFAYGTTTAEIYIWKESDAGYKLHRKLLPTYLSYSKPFISPDGESIVTTHGFVIQLWRTADPTPSPSVDPTRSGDYFILEFSPDETLAVVGRVLGNTATVLDLKSGDPRLIVDAGMGIIGLRVTLDTIVVVGEGKIVTWTLPTGDCTFNARVNTDESVRATTYNYSVPYRRIMFPCASVSPNLNQVAIVKGFSDGLDIHDASTGEHLAGTIAKVLMPWFTPDGHEVWCMPNRTLEGWAIVKDSESGVAKLEPVGPTIHPSGGIPQRSSRGYQVSDDWWVVSPSGKRLLWLPHDWRSYEWSRRWSGRFLGLWHKELPEAVILELGE